MPGDHVKIGDITAGRDVDINFADLSEVEKLLKQIVSLLREMHTFIRVDFCEHQREKIFVVDAQGREIEIPEKFISSLGALQRRSEPLQREEIYLTRFVLDHLYARWERDYLPLEGILKIEPGLRLQDDLDPAISQAGTKLKDLRQAILDYQKTRLVILGEPGAGKTTTLQRLALDMARERLRDPVQYKIPVWIDLFKYNDSRNPSDFLASEWQYTGLSGTYGESIAYGQVCFLLDGVNQMPSADRGNRVEKWAHWANSHNDLPEGNWAIFTCRTVDYISSLKLPEIHVQTLDEDHIHRYLDLRFGPEQSSRYWGDFDRRLRSGDQRFVSLARNPFMLSLLVDYAAAGRGLTNNRASLMDHLAERLIRHELEYGRQPDALTVNPRETLNAIINALSRIAFAMQSRRGEGTVITEAEARRLDLDYKKGAVLTFDEVLNLALNSHMLEPTTIDKKKRKVPAYVFYHHLLQEYFAANRLLELFRHGRKRRRYVHVGWRQLWAVKPKKDHPISPAPVTGWEETIIMSASLAGKDVKSFIRYVARHNLPLAGRCLAAIEIHTTDLQTSAESLRSNLLARQRNPWARMNARIDAGLALGELGHPDLQAKVYEFEGRSISAILPPLQVIPAGEFLFGSEAGDKQAFDDEMTRQRLYTTPAYAVGRYCVTNAEFWYFVEAGGYKEDRWWSEAGRLWKQGGPDAHAGAIQDWLDTRKYFQTREIEKIAQANAWPGYRLRFWKRMLRYSDEDAEQQAIRQFERPFDRPAYWDDPDLSSPARPVVGVNWYEAEAYCSWLSAIAQHSFRLPTELEWEKAARSEDVRQYPWGDRFEWQNCNTVEGGIYTTVPVGQFSKGLSPYGIYEASGNVWEWTASWYQAYPESPGESDDFGERFRVLRGGSWNYTRRNARCACRGGSAPDLFDNVVGFRVLSH